MARSNVTASQSQTHWRDYLPQDKGGDEQRKEKAEERRAGWDNLLNPEEGAFLPHVATRLAFPQLWLSGGLWLIRSFPGLELFLVPLWLMPAIGVAFVIWKQSSVSRGWIYPNLFLIGVGLALGILGVA